jgi:SpoVK/Ycf46/Vps4 family AAA+-type ATPase
MQGYRNSREHVFEELRRLDLLLNGQVARQRHDPTYAGFNEFRGLFISDEEIDLIVGQKKSESESDAARGEAEMSRLFAAIAQLEHRIAIQTEAAVAQGVHLSLSRVVRLFHLTPFDVGALLVCLAPELDRKYEKLYAYLQNAVTRQRPSVDFILTLFCQSLAEKLQARTRLIAAAPLFRQELLAYTNDAHNEPPTLLSRFLKIDERIFNYLLDIDVVDEPLMPFTKLLAPCASLEALLLPAGLKEPLVRFFQAQAAALACNEKDGARVFLFHGPAGVGKKFTAAALCQSAGMSLLVADVPQILSKGSTVASLALRLLREARLRSAAVYLDHAEALLAEDEKTAGARQMLLKALEEWPGIVFLGSEEPWDASTAPQAEVLFRLVFPTPSYPLRRQLWQTFCRQGGYQVAPQVDLDALADRFNFTAGKIRSALSEASYLALVCHPNNEAISTDDLYQACRTQSSTKLTTLARKITPLYTWQDLILPSDHLGHLREICAHVKYRQQVFDVWGFDHKIALGKGLSVLFVGPSGTGKTMAAEIIAGELKLDLYKIDLSCVVSKYIGETEKNLSKIFQEAEQSNAILFFDEADAIFGKRSEVKDSHDRYANIEINYLLQKLEEYEGIVILASNFQKNMDEAFTRRMRFIIEFPFPDEAYRYRIWQSVFPQDTPLGDDIDFEFLAKKFKMSGGNIKNIAMGAAFLAAEDSGIVSMEPVIRATKREFQKMGRLCVKADFEHYFELVKSE